MFGDYKKKKLMEDEMSPMEKEAKMGVLSGLQAEGNNSMLDKLKGLKKVEVASDSSEGLETGLEKAQELINKHDSDDGLESRLPLMSNDELEMLIQKAMDEKKNRGIGNPGNSNNPGELNEGSPGESSY